MPAKELLARLRSLGYAATAEGGRLKLRGPCRPPADLERQITNRRDELVKILREDEELRRTGIIQSGRQVFGMARDRFGSTRPFDPTGHPLSKRKMWTTRTRRRSSSRNVTRGAAKRTRKPLSSR